MSNDVHYGPGCDADPCANMGACGGSVLVWSEWRSEDRRWACACDCHREITPEVKEAAARAGFFFSGDDDELWVSNGAEARAYPYRQHAGAQSWVARYLRRMEGA